MREPIPEIADAARLLDEAVSAHLIGQRDLAKELIHSADIIPAITAFGESLWGRKSVYRQVRDVADTPPIRPKEQRALERNANAALKRDLIRRDGYHCRFCGMAVVREKVRERIRHVYREALRWGRRNEQQHAAFQVMCVNYDHIMPHARGGSTDLANMVITCAACNYGRRDYTLDQVGVLHPDDIPLVHSTWNGLERFR